MISTDAQRISHTDWLITLGVFSMAFTVRLAFLLASADQAWPHSIWYEGDAPDWVQFAAALDRNNPKEPYELGLPMRPPAVAYFIHWLAPGKSAAVMWGAAPQSFLSLKIVWCFISSITCALAYMAFRMQVNRRIALAAAGLCTFSFALYVTATSLNNETLYTFLLIGLVIGWQGLIGQPTLWLAALVGILHGLATLTRPEHSLLLLLLLTWAAFRWRIISIPFLVRRLQPTGINVIQRRSKRLLIAQLATIFFSSILVCLPWTIRGAHNIQQFNTVTMEVIDFDHARADWTPEARTVIQSLPAFARYGNFRFADEFLHAQGATVIQGADVEQFLMRQFGYMPKPISPWVFVSIKGPLDFALANHPAAHGAFSKAAMWRNGEVADPPLMLGRPDHLHLVNDGYSIGFGYIRSDFGAWLKGVGAKLSNFCAGITLGFTSRNIPVGLHAVRRPVDIATAENSPEFAQPVPILVNHGWRILVFACVAIGVLSALRDRKGGIWMVIVLYKLIVTILFYGYARQAVSILPAFYAFIALGMNELGERAIILRRISSTWRVAVGFAMVVALLVLDLSADLLPCSFETLGQKTPKPRLGDSAFTSYLAVHINPITAPLASTSQPRAPAAP